MKTESIFPIIFGGSDANRSKAKPISSILVDRVVESPCIESAGRVSQVKLKSKKFYMYHHQPTGIFIDCFYLHVDLHVHVRVVSTCSRSTTIRSRV